MIVSFFKTAHEKFQLQKPSLSMMMAGFLTILAVAAIFAQQSGQTDINDKNNNKDDNNNINSKDDNENNNINNKDNNNNNIDDKNNNKDDNNNNKDDNKDDNSSNSSRRKNHSYYSDLLTRVKEVRARKL